MPREQPWAVLEPSAPPVPAAAAPARPDVELSSYRQPYEKWTPKAFGKSLGFGAMVGATCGATFGMMDGFKAAADLAQSSGGGAVAKARVVGFSAGFASARFGAFFAGYQGIKYSLACARGTNDALGAAGAGAISILPVLRMKNARTMVPYAVVLIVLDAYHDDS